MQIMEHYNIWTGSSHQSDLVAETTAAVRCTEALNLACRNTSKELWELSTVLRAWSLVGNGAALNARTANASHSTSFNSGSSFAETTEDLLKSFFVDRRIRQPSNYYHH